MKELMTLQEVVEYTGFKKGYLYQLTSKRKISSYKPFGKMLFFKRSEIEELFLSGKRKSLNEIEREAQILLTSKL